ncbi:MAG: FAD-dependent oxidoreductase, partial [Anaerolineae bacterium]
MSAFDLAVVGAGPAGCLAAQTAAERGLRVLLLEARPRLGQASPCAGLVPRLIRRSVDLPRGAILQETEGLRTFLPDGTVHELNAPGYVLDRRLFDRHLAEEAVRAGATLRLGCR